ncbi:16573_t:CDS:10 [Entrophospora sp. SA101]|nr:16573_t:CDS:10 [Entrophospora sp. SA101]
MFYKYKNKEYLLNLIDTPGHVDFNYEVSRSLAACQGTILLIDATQGIQAQTVANFYLAFDQGLTIIPVINKIDLQAANVDRVIKQINSTFKLDTSEILLTSAKSGLNVDKLLPKVIEQVPQPSGDINKPLKAFLFDSWYDTYVGVISLMSIVDGRLQKGDRIVSAYSNNKYEVLDIGIMYPEQVSTDYLHSGQVGYVICGMKAASEAHIGDTFYHDKIPVDPLPGFEPAKPMVFAGIFPVDTNEFNKLDESITKLTINDASVSIQKETSMALGQGWRIGFLGTLHMDVFRQRLEEEYGANIIITQPTVPYKVVYKDGKESFVQNPTEFPDSVDLQYKILEFQEPMVLATIILPETKRGEQQEYNYLDESRVMMKYEIPLAEIVIDFHDELKSRSSGYASFDYEDMGYQKSDIVKMDVLLNKKPVDALAAIMHRSQVNRVGKEWTKKLADAIV